MKSLIIALFILVSYLILEAYLFVFDYKQFKAEMNQINGEVN